MPFIAEFNFISPPNISRPIKPKEQVFAWFLSITTNGQSFYAAYQHHHQQQQQQKALSFILARPLLHLYGLETRSERGPLSFTHFGNRVTYGKPTRAPSRLRIWRNELCRPGSTGPASMLVPLYYTPLLCSARCVGMEASRVSCYVGARTRRATWTNDAKLKKFGQY